MHFDDFKNLRILILAYLNPVSYCNDFLKSKFTSMYISLMKVLAGWFLIDSYNVFHLMNNKSKNVS